jgi:serine/threonine protein kinase
MKKCNEQMSSRRVLFQSEDCLITTDGQFAFKMVKNPGGPELCEMDIVTKTAHPYMVDTRAYDIDWEIHETLSVTPLAVSTVYKLGNSVSWPVLRSWFVMMFQVLEALHANGIMHGDVKPDNMFVYSVHQVRLADFGLACRFGAKPMKRGHTERQTYLYRSPEYLKNGYFSASADVWAMGASIFEFVYPGQRVLPYHNDVRSRIRPILRAQMPIHLPRTGTRRLSEAQWREIRVLLEHTLVPETERWTAAQCLEHLGAPRVPCTRVAPVLPPASRVTRNKVARFYYTYLSSKLIPRGPSRELAAQLVEKYGEGVMGGAIICATAMTYSSLMDDLHALTTFHPLVDAFLQVSRAS